MRVAVVGVGAWGRNYLNTLDSVLGKDTDSGFTVYPISKHSSITVSHLESGSVHVDFAIIATPPQVRFEIAKKLIKAKIPLILEKPVALSSKETAKLSDLADKYDVPCLVAYTDLYNPAYQAFRFWVSSVLRSKSSTRTLLGSFGNVNPGKFPTYWDYGPHVLAVLQDIFGGLENVRAEHKGNLTTITAVTQENVLVHVRCGAPFTEKERRYMLTSYNEDLSVRSNVCYSDTLRAHKVCVQEGTILHSPPYEDVPPLTALVQTMVKTVRSTEKSALNYQLRRSVDYARILEKLD